MNEQEKALKLAELMGWEIHHKYQDIVVGCGDAQLYMSVFDPYAKTINGLAQFASIMVYDGALTNRVLRHMDNNQIKFTQVTLLDSYLEFTGYIVEADE